jgi:hypothetical protein
MIVCEYSEGLRKTEASNKVSEPVFRHCWLRLLVVIACGSAGAAEDDVVGPIDACSLLPTTAIHEALERKVGEPQHADSGYVAGGAFSSTCMWTVSLDSSAGATKRRLVILHAMRWPRGKAGTFLEQFYEAAKNGELPRKPIPRKIGDEALWWGDGVAVRKGDVSFGISVLVAGISLEKSGHLEEALAQQVLRKVGDGMH